MTRLTLFFLLTMGIMACKNQGASDVSADGDGIHFGETITADGALDYDAFISKMKGQDSLMVKIKAKVGEVCQAKGCWMNVFSESTAETEKLFVQFKDYGFFMPKDLTGSTVVLEGKAYREETSVEDLRHFAEDEGKSAEEIALITEPKNELKFMASGVLKLD
jgi:hypothetical protein